MRTFALVVFCLSAGALAQRAAGTYQPALTEADRLNFHQGPDGGTCASSSGRARTDQGEASQVNTEPTCPTTAAQAARVAACESMARALLNRAARVQDGGL